jgi:hypothetical protein
MEASQRFEREASGDSDFLLEFDFQTPGAGLSPSPRTGRRPSAIKAAIVAWLEQQL